MAFHCRFVCFVAVLFERGLGGSLKCQFLHVYLADAIAAGYHHAGERLNRSGDESSKNDTYELRMFCCWLSASMSCRMLVDISCYITVPLTSHIVMRTSVLEQTARERRSPAPSRRGHRHLAPALTHRNKRRMASDAPV